MITGIRVNELLPLKVHQLKTLLAEGWIKIDRSKRGPASHKAYLSKQGKKILKSRQKDFDLLYLFKDDNSYIFTSQLDHNKHIRREQITKDINKIMALVSEIVLLHSYGKTLMISNLSDKLLAIPN